MLNGFTKKTHKTPKKELDEAVNLKKEYFQQKTLIMDTKSWKEIKDNVYGVKGTERRNILERDFERFKIGQQLKKAPRRKKPHPKPVIKHN